MFRHAATTLTALVSTTDPSRPADAPAPKGRAVNGRGRSRRPHLVPLVIGLIDARVGGVDYLDTIGGEGADEAAPSATARPAQPLRSDGPVAAPSRAAMLHQRGEDPLRQKGQHRGNGPPGRPASRPASRPARASPTALHPNRAAPQPIPARPKSPKPVPASGAGEGLSDSLNGGESGGADGFGEGGEVAFILLGVVL